MSNKKELKDAPAKPKSQALGKGRYAIYQTPEGDGVISYRPDGEESDSHQVIPAKFWGILMGILSGEIKDITPMALMKLLMGK